MDKTHVGFVDISGTDPAQALVEHLRRLSREEGIATYFLPECPMCGDDQPETVCGVAIFRPPREHCAIGHVFCERHRDPRHAASGAMGKAVAERVAIKVTLVAGTPCQCGCVRMPAGSAQA